jgi:hypothetical protein
LHALGKLAVKREGTLGEEPRRRRTSDLGPPDALVHRGAGGIAGYNINALDCAAYAEGQYLNSADLVQCLKLKKHPASIEDGFDEKDYEGSTKMTAAFAEHSH